MTSKISSFVAGILCLCFSLATHAKTPAEIFKQMSVQQRVGQVFIWTYSGTTLSPTSQRYLEKYQPGALIVFSRNIKSPAQIAKFNIDSQNLALKKMRAPFFLMIDQEGGVVTRLRTRVPLPSALALGRMEDAEFVKNFGRANAEVLRSVGFNVNLAPVLDISNPEKDSFIGNRAFGNDPEAVAEVAVAYARGIHEGGVIPTAKHFPGHGSIVQDSHHTTPKKLSTEDELNDNDLVPFQQYAQAEFPRAVMMAHLSLPNIDPSGLPSTYSPLIIKDYLRTKLKYNGLVITDDLEMNGASIDKDIGERAVRAFLAGNDMLMVAGSPSRQKRAYAAIEQAVQSGRISEPRLKESVIRILTVKEESKLSRVPYSPTQTRAAITKLENLSREVLKQNFQDAASAPSVQWPDWQEDAKILVLSSDRRFFENFRKGFQGTSEFFALTPKSLSQVTSEITKTDYQHVVFYVSGTQTARWLNQINPELRRKLIIVNANHPGEVEQQSSFQTVLNINSLNPECGLPLGEALNNPSTRFPATTPDGPSKSPSAPNEN